LSRLPRFPIDSLKIDRVFVSQVATDHENFEIVKLITMLAHNLGLKVVAEGAETEEQISILKRLGCEFAQGFFFSPPVSADSACALLIRDYCEVEVPAEPA
jgi:EAL domain-containing protein (putative c-di-GMP-specific phosphodiesterase class I)